MDQSVSKLTIICPPAHSERINELMTENDPPVFGFTSWTAEATGFVFGSPPSNKRVREHATRSIFVAITTTEAAIALVKNIVDSAEAPHLTYWIEAVIALGELRPSNHSNLASRLET